MRFEGCQNDLHLHEDLAIYTLVLQSLCQIMTSTFGKELSTSTAQRIATNFSQKNGRQNSTEKSFVYQSPYSYL